MVRIFGSTFRRLRAGGMSSPASCEGGGVKSRQPNGTSGELGGELKRELRGELGGVDSGEVRSEMSSGFMIVVVSTGKCPSSFGFLHECDQFNLWPLVPLLGRLNRSDLMPNPSTAVRGQIYENRR